MKDTLLELMNRDLDENGIEKDQMKKYYNKFLNWLIPGRRSRILAKMIIRNQRLGLYEDPFKSNENER